MVFLLFLLSFSLIGFNTIAFAAEASSPVKSAIVAKRKNSLPSVHDSTYNAAKLRTFVGRPRSKSLTAIPHSTVRHDSKMSQAAAPVAQAVPKQVAGDGERQAEDLRDQQQEMVDDAIGGLLAHLLPRGMRAPETTLFIFIPR